MGGTNVPIYANGGTFNWTSGTLNVSNGSLTVGDPTSLGTSLALSNGMNLIITGTGQSLNVTGAMNVSGGGLNVPTINQTAGTFTDTGSLTLAASGGNAVTYNHSAGTLSAAAISIASGGVLNLQTNNSTGIAVQTLPPISMSGSAPYGQMNVLYASNHSNRQLVVTTGLTFAGAANAWQGIIDLSDNDMDVQGGSLANITNQIKQGYNGGRWNGIGGILSTSAAADTTHLTALGVIQNNQSGVGSVHGSNPFDNFSPNAGDILVKYTYYGDANLDGKVDGSDYSLIDTAYLADKSHPTVTGWYNGDFNYDGVVNGIGLHTDRQCIQLAGHRSYHIHRRPGIDGYQSVSRIDRSS